MPTSVPTWLILQLLAIASMPATYDMACDRGRSPRPWLYAAFFFGPLALLMLLALGRRDRAVRHPTS
jgi:hypothetical protein